MKPKNSALFLVSWLFCQLAGASQHAELLLKRPYEFRVPGYSLRYILPQGRYRFVGREQDGAFYFAAGFLRREEVYRETAFSAELVRGGLVITQSPTRAEFFVYGPHHRPLRYKLPEEFDRRLGELWRFTR